MHLIKFISLIPFAHLVYAVPISLETPIGFPHGPRHSWSPQHDIYYRTTGIGMTAGSLVGESLAKKVEDDLDAIKQADMEMMLRNLLDRGVWD